MAGLTLHDQGATGVISEDEYGEGYMGRGKCRHKPGSVFAVSCAMYRAVPATKWPVRLRHAAGNLVSAAVRRLPQRQISHSNAACKGCFQSALGPPWDQARLFPAACQCCV